MRNMIKMDLYRMFHMRSLYVISLVFIAAVYFTTSMSVIDYQYIMEEAQLQSPEEEENIESVNIGMNMMLPTRPGEPVTFADQVYANLQSKFLALFLVIFAVLFAGADISSGYIKNIGGQVQNRGRLIWSKAAALAIFTVLSMLMYLLLQSVMQRICFGYLEWGNVPELLRYTGTQLLLHYALVLISMSVAVILRSSAVSMTLVICMTMNMMMLLYSAADHLLRKVGLKQIQIEEYTVTGNMHLLPMTPGNRECLTAAAVSAAFGLGAVLLTGWIFRKRDI